MDGWPLSTSPQASGPAVPGKYSFGDGNHVGEVPLCMLIARLQRYFTKQLLLVASAQIHFIIQAGLAIESVLES